MKLFFRNIFSLFLLFFLHIANAQDNTMYLLRSLPQNSSINASYIPEGKAFIGFPALSALHASYYNSGFVLKDILHSGANSQADSLVIDYNSFGNALSANNVYFQDLSNTWLAFGVKVKNSYFSLSVNSKLKSKALYPGTLGDWMKGNYDYETMKTQSLTTDGLALNSLAYNDISLGWARSFGDKLTVGLHIKYILGVSNIKSEKFNVTLNTLSNTELQLHTDVVVQTSLPLIVTLDSLNFVDSVKFDNHTSMNKLMFDNSGFGIDMGVTYKPIPRLSIGLALNDLGVITWKTYSHTFTSQSNFNFNGVDLSNMFGDNGSNPDYWKQMEDSIKNSFKIQQNNVKYRTGLQGNIIVTSKLQMLKWLDLGAMLKTQFYQGRMYPEFGLACAMSPSKLFSSTISYSMRKGSYFNIGTGIVFNPGPMQIYMVTDNLPHAFAIQNAKVLNVRLGINFLIGTGTHVKKEEMKTASN